MSEPVADLGLAYECARLEMWSEEMAERMGKDKFHFSIYGAARMCLFIKERGLEGEFCEWGNEHEADLIYGNDKEQQDG